MNPNPPKTLKVLHGVFAGFHWLFVFCLLGILYKLVVCPASIVATVGLAPDTPMVASLAGEPASGSIRPDAFEAVLRVPVGPAASAELKSVARVCTLPWMFVAAGAGLILCNLAQRLIRNLETGEMFSDRNVKLLRVFAVVLVAATVLTRVLEGLGTTQFSRYAAAHLAVGGARVLNAAGTVTIGELGLNLGNADVLVILLLLLIVWAFREGATLKRDSDLTI